MNLKLFTKHLLQTIQCIPNLVCFIKRFGIKPFSIRTQLTIAERIALFSLSSSKKQKKVIVEIGSYLGASSVFLAAAAKESNSKLYCVDTWNNDAMSEGKNDTYAAFLENTQDYEDTIIAIRGDSSEIAKRMDVSIDILFIDGDHSYEGCKTDVISWLPKLVDRGTIILHDYSWAEGVKKVVKEEVYPKQTGKSRIIHSLYCGNILQP